MHMDLQHFIAEYIKLLKFHNLAYGNIGDYNVETRTTPEGSKITVEISFHHHLSR